MVSSVLNKNGEDGQPIQRNRSNDYNCRFKSIALQSLKQRQLLAQSETGGTDKYASIGSIYTLFLNLTAPEKESKSTQKQNDLYHRSAG